MVHRGANSNRPNRFCLQGTGLAFTIAILLPLLTDACFAAGATNQLPPFGKIAAVVNSYFASNADFQQHDLINQSLVHGALVEVARAGWEVSDADALARRALPQDSFLVRIWSQRAGRSFLRKVARMPGGYSQLDQLSSTDDGEKHIKYLVRHKDGHLLIKYLTTTQGGRNLGRKMAQVPHGVNLNRPTNRIYTVNEFLTELQKAYDEEAAKLGH